MNKLFVVYVKKRNTIRLTNWLSSLFKKKCYRNSLDFILLFVLDYIYQINSPFTYFVQRILELSSTIQMIRKTRHWMKGITHNRAHTRPRRSHAAHACVLVCRYRYTFVRAPRAPIAAPARTHHTHRHTSHKPWAYTSHSAGGGCARWSIRAVSRSAVVVALEPSVRRNPL